MALNFSVFMHNLKFRPYSKLSGLAIVPHVPELQVDYRNLLKIIYSGMHLSFNSNFSWTIIYKCPSS